MKCDAEKFTEMYKNVYKDLYKFALCMMKNPHDAEDATSEAIMQAYMNISALRDENAFKSWIFKILFHICTKKLQKKTQTNIVAFEKVTEQEHSSAVETDYDLSLDLRKAFSILSEEEKTIVGLSVFGGYKSAEIGKILHMNANTVRSKRHRALEKMSVILS